MTYTSFDDHAGIPSSVGPMEQAVHSLVHNLFTPLRRAAKYRQLTRELSGLNNRELAQLGLARRDIRRIARESARDV